MKKVITILATAGIAGAATAGAQQGPILDTITVESVFAFESEYSFRGVKLGGPSLQPGVEVGILDGYVGTWMSMPLDRTPRDGNEVDFYGGYVFPLGGIVSLDVGYTYYWYPNEALGHGHDSEPYAGLAFDAPFDPEFYVFHEIENEVTTFEGSASYSFDLAEHGFWNTSLDFGGYLGYVINGEDYFYYGATADLVYPLNEAAFFSVGARFAGNSENFAPDRQLWWGTAVGISF